MINQEGCQKSFKYFLLFQYHGIYEIFYSKMSNKTIIVFNHNPKLTSDGRCERFCIENYNNIEMIFYDLGRVLIWDRISHQNVEQDSFETILEKIKKLISS